MHAGVPFPVKKSFLYVLVASVLLSAFLGITAILVGRFGWFELRIILTSTTVSLASICGLACAAYLGTGPKGYPLAVAGIGLAILAAMLIIAGIWGEFASLSHWKLAVSLSVFAVACAHLSLLSMARLAAWFQWSLFAAYMVIFGIATLIVAMIYLEINAVGMFQLLGVAVIIDAAITILVPLFHRLSRSEFDLTPATAKDRIAVVDKEIEALKAKIAELEVKKQTAAG